MHVSRNQFDPFLELNHINATAKAEAQKEAERTRKRLREAAAALAGEDGYVVRLGSREGQEGSEEQERGSEGQRRGSDGQRPMTNLSQMIRGLYGN